jgi:DNA-binding transcriptional MerR regulator
MGMGYSEHRLRSGATIYMRARETKRQARPEIPDKLYFRIGDVAKLCGVETYVLRFWETEFPQLKPGKSGTGQRLYRKRDVECALRIKQLLHDQGYTIVGARQAMKSDSKTGAQPELPFAGGRAMGSKLEKLRTELKEILAMVSDGEKRPSASGSKKKSLSRDLNLPRVPGPELFS